MHASQATQSNLNRTAAHRQRTARHGQRQPTCRPGRPMPFSGPTRAPPPRRLPPPPRHAPWHHGGRRGTAPSSGTAIDLCTPSDTCAPCQQPTPCYPAPRKGSRTKVAAFPSSYGQQSIDLIWAQQEQCVQSASHVSSAKTSPRLCLDAPKGTLSLSFNTPRPTSTSSVKPRSNVPTTRSSQRPTCPQVHPSLVSQQTL
jgi:hypothetical protein